MVLTNLSGNLRQRNVGGRLGVQGHGSWLGTAEGGLITHKRGGGLGGGV